MTKEITFKIKIPEFAFLKNAFCRVLTDTKTKWKRGILSLFIAGLFFWWAGVSAGLLWLLFLLFLVYEWENRVIGVLALLALASCPFLLSFNQNALAEQMAVYAYFFLVMTVVLQIIEYKRRPEEFKEEINDTE